MIYIVYFSSLKLSPHSNILYVGNQSGRLFKIINPNNNPSTYEIGSPSFPAANISSIDIGENDNEILITFSNYGVHQYGLVKMEVKTGMKKKAIFLTCR